MKNRAVGILIIAIAVLIGFIILSFNMAMSEIISSACAHGDTCPMWGTIDFQTNVSLGVMTFVILIGLYLIFFGKDERIVTRIRKIRSQFEPKKLTKENYQKVMRSLDRDEKKIFGNIIDSNGTILQSDLVKGTKFSKVKITRILDKLEGKSLIERRRRGMSNIIILKH